MKTLNMTIVIGNPARLLALVGLVMLVSACCSPGTRPEDANLFQASCGMASGDFDEQLKSDKAQAESSREALNAEQHTAQTLEADLESVKAERIRLLTELDEMAKESHQLEAQIADMQADSERAKNQQKALHADQERIEEELVILKQKASVEQDAYLHYRTEAARLKQEIDVLRMIISAQ